MPRKRIKTRDCANCNHKFNEVDNFCPNCGQENHSYNQSFTHLAMELIEAELHFDTKLWHTAKSMVMRPGEIVSDFIADRRARHVPPFRLYVFSSFIMFFLSGFLSSGAHKDASHDSAEHSEESGFQISPSTSGKPITISRRMDDGTIQRDTIMDVNDTINVGVNFGFKSNPDGSATVFLDSERKKFFNFTKKEIEYIKKHELADSDSIFLSKSKSTGWLERRFMLGSIRLSDMNSHQRHDFMHILQHRFQESLFALMPIFAFILYILNIRRKRNYYEYLIFSVYFHASVFILLILNLLIQHIFHTNDDIFLLVILGSWVYMWVSLKRVYELSWLKSFLKASLMGVIYTIIIGFVLLFLLLLGVVV